MAGVLAAPAVALGSAADGTAASLILAAAAALGVFIEYGARVPSIVDFRFAPPLNRFRFALVSAVLLSVTFSLTSFGGAWPFAAVSSALDHPYSPARLAAESLTRSAALGPDPRVQRAAAAALAVSGLCTFGFGALILFGRWPARPRSFNFATNFPTLEQPTEPGGRPSLARRLRWLGWQVLITAVALLFALQVLGGFAGQILEPEALQSPLVIAWSATAWAAAPGVLALRGIAILRIARLARRGESV